MTDESHPALFDIEQHKREPEQFFQIMLMHFRNAEHLAEFSKMIGVPCTKRVKVLDWPQPKMNGSEHE